jgi:hypothetical protein
MQTMREENGSSLSLGQQLRWIQQSQVFYAFPHLRLNWARLPDYYRYC